MSKAKASIVILASGRGTNAKALMEFARANPDLVCVKGLISDRTGIPALEVAEKFSVPTFVVDHKKESELLGLLGKLSPDWACLAGYKRMVSEAFLRFFEDKARGFFRVLNVHPSLLPAYPGLNCYERAWKDGCKETGVTVHFVDQGLDSGAAVLQEKFPIHPEDTAADVEKRGLEVEHRLFPEALRLALLGKIVLGGKK